MRPECNEGGSQFGQFLATPPLGGSTQGYRMADIEAFTGTKADMTRGFQLNLSWGMFLRAGHLILK